LAFAAFFAYAENENSEVKTGMRLGSRDELKRPNACVLILLMLIPVLALVTIADNVAVAACSCPYGGRYYSSINTKLCGLQTNVCVSFDYNCADDYPAVCGVTTTTQNNYVPTTHNYVPTTTVQTTPPKIYSNTCPYGGQYYSSIYTSLCGWQYNVCVTWDNNCADDYQAVSTGSAATRATTYIGTGTSCGYIEMMMGQCGQRQPYAQPQTTITTTTTRSTTAVGTGTSCGYLEMMMGQCGQGHYTVILTVKSQYAVAYWKVYVDGNYLGLTDSQGTLKMTLTGGPHNVELESVGGPQYLRATSQFYVNSDGQVVTVTAP
jgi:hypothetical protein